ncbi:uncharacterized protein LOC143034638 [Oratosquilla oratoria]|uniref:uncharacterized protein LOC143034638 n=1 Tax=Oratosquilla oratoria TaxID=337810 RepID=UPI003F758608
MTNSTDSKTEGQATVMSQIEDTSREIRECYERLDMIETRLRKRNYPTAEKQRMEGEVKEIKNHLSKHETELRSLRGENRVAMVMSVLLVILVGLIYGVYMLLFKS